jgi:16S rRNA (cytosine1402-N4)-methyltransferase
MNQHIPVLLGPIIDNYREYNISNIVFDGTYGGGGYSNALAQLGATVYACDLDNNAISRTTPHQSIKLTQANFANYIQDFANEYFDLIVVDLGFSNNQLWIDEKGFSYMASDQILDLRFDESQGLSASQFLMESSVAKIAAVLYENSGDNFSRKIAYKIGDNRDKVSEIRVGDLEQWIIQALPDKFRNTKNSVMSRIWQALRIHVNSEFYWLNKFLETAPKKLKKGGILCVVNFHSLEDKITTKSFRQLSKTYDLDNYGNKHQDFQLLTKQPITPDAQELESNPQSRSATLRILYRCPELNKSNTISSKPIPSA